MVVLARGATVVFPAGISGPEIAAAARDTHPTALLAVPRLCEALWSSVCSTIERRGVWAARLFRALLEVCSAVRRVTGLRAGRWVFGSLHATFGGRLEVIGCGGAHLDPQLARRLEALGWTVLTGYGLTETSPVLTFNDRSNSRLGSEGRPLSGVEIAIRRTERAAFTALARGSEQGEIVARGASIFRGYAGNDVATQSAFTADGWFRTGDLGWIDRAGYLHVVGRSKELIALADGKKVFPEEIEKIYATSPLIREVAILEHRGRLAALVVPNEAATERGAAAEVRFFAKRSRTSGATASVPAPYGLRSRAFSLPRTQLGKLKRHLLADLYAKASILRHANQRFYLRRMRAGCIRPGCRSLAVASRPLPGPRAHARHEPPARPRYRLARMALPHARNRGTVRRSADGRRREPHPLVARPTPRNRSAAPYQPALPARRLETQSSAQPDDARVRRRNLRAGMGRYARPSLELAGRLPLDSDGPLLIAPNHTSYLDPPAIAAALPWRRLRKTFWAGWVGILYTGPFTRFISRACQILPVDPDRDLAGAIETARSLLRRGYSIVWFPEGRRSPTGELGCSSAA